MDVWALHSHRRAVAATESGRLREEIVAVDGILPDGTSAPIDYDQGPRADTTIEKIRSLPAVYRADGRISAATAAQQSDGAAVCMIMSRQRADALGLKPLARIHTVAVGACAPTDLIYSAVPATRKALDRSRMTIGDIDVIEVNEAFACAPIAVMRELGMKESDAERINVNGGACALGHPVGASGARLVGTTALELRRRGGAFGLAAICGGMGQGAATIVEAC
jgi:acetyl-CoA C-acetyltransferase/acetyl-CoA acyltransferase